MIRQWGTVGFLQRGLTKTIASVLAIGNRIFPSAQIEKHTDRWREASSADLRSGLETKVPPSQPWRTPTQQSQTCAYSVQQTNHTRPRTCGTPDLKVLKGAAVEREDFVARRRNCAVKPAQTRLRLRPRGHNREQQRVRPRHPACLCLPPQPHVNIQPRRGVGKLGLTATRNGAERKRNEHK